MGLEEREAFVEAEGEVEEVAGTRLVLSVALAGGEGGGECRGCSGGREGE